MSSKLMYGMGIPLCRIYGLRYAHLLNVSVINKTKECQMRYRLIFIIGLLALVSLTIAQNPSSLWGGKIYDLNFNGYHGQFQVFTITLQNTGKGIERYLLNAFIVSDPPEPQAKRALVKEIWKGYETGPVSPTRTRQLRLDFRGIPYAEGLSYRLIIQLTEYGYPHRVLDETFYYLKR